MIEERKEQLRLKLSTIETEIQIANDETFLLVKEDEKRSESLKKTIERLTKTLAQVRRDLAVVNDERTVLMTDELSNIRFLLDTKELTALQKLADDLIDLSDASDSTLMKFDVIVAAARIIRRRPLRDPSENPRG